MKRAVVAAALLAAAPPHAGDLEITVQGVRNANGHVLAELCPRERFLEPRCPYRAGAPAAAGSVTVRIPNVPPGVYAAQVFHDENDNKIVDRSWIGIPEEGLGFSNDAKFRFGPPRFDDAAIRIGPDGGRIALTLRYFD